MLPYIFSQGLRPSFGAGSWDLTEHYKVCVFQERKLAKEEGKLRRTRKKMPLPKARKYKVIRWMTLTCTT